MNQGNEINIGKTKDGHDQIMNTKFIYNLWEEKRIEMPEFIQDIMFQVLNQK